MALMLSKKKSGGALIGAVLAIIPYTSNAQHIISRICDLENKTTVNTDHIYYDTGVICSNGDYSLKSDGSASMSLVTTQACEVYDATGTLVGTTVGGSDFNLSLNPTANPSATFVIIPA